MPGLAEFLHKTRQDKTGGIRVFSQVIVIGVIKEGVIKDL